MWSRLGIQSKLLAMLLGVSIVSILATGLISYRLASTALTQAAKDKVVAVGDARLKQITAAEASLRTNTILNSTGIAQNAMQNFEAGYRALNKPVSAADRAAADSYYQQVFVPNLAPSAHRRRADLGGGRPGRRGRSPEPGHQPLSRARRDHPGAVLLITLLSTLLARAFTRPVKRLLSGVREVAGGNLAARVVPKGDDEFADLGLAFNDMAASLSAKQELLDEQMQENDRIVSTLMPETVARRYRGGEQNIVEEHVDVSVVYGTIDGLDEGSRGRSAAESLGVLNEIVQVVDRAAQKHSLEKGAHPAFGILRDVRARRPAGRPRHPVPRARSRRATGRGDGRREVRHEPAGAGGYRLRPGDQWARRLVSRLRPVGRECEPRLPC